MELRDYLEGEGISVKEFSLRVGVTSSRVYAWLDGEFPSRKNCEKISNATNGEVSIFDLWGLPPKVSDLSTFNKKK